MMSTRHTLAWGTTVVVASAASFSAQAQLIEDIEFRRDGANAIVQVRFAARLNFLRSLSARSGDLVQAFYEVLPQQQLTTTDSSERRIQGAGAIPSIVLTDESSGVGNRGALSRKLVVRLSGPTKARVRAGRDNRSLEVVLDGLGPSVTQLAAVPLVEKANSSGSTGRYYINLQSEQEPNLRLSASVPAKLQDYPIFTSTRSVDGRTVHEINLGYFADRSSAQEALALLTPRFPKAEVVERSVLSPNPTIQANPSSPTPGTASATASPSPSGTGVQPSVPGSSVSPDAQELLRTAQVAYDAGEFASAIGALNQLLALPPNASSRRAQELIGMARAKAGETARARAEFELFLALYPQGDDSSRVREAMAALGPAATPATAGAPTPTEAPPSPWSGSLSAFYFGGQARTRSQDFQDSPLSGLPQPISENQLSTTDQRQVQVGTDINWRQRDSSSDSRFTFRNSYTKDLINDDKSKNRLSALYWDYRALKAGANVRLGRQSPTGGGVLNRFDGLQAGYVFQPKWRINAVVGVPTEKLLDTKRRFYGTWLDAEALTQELSGSLYLNQQTIDGEVDRRAVGVELRYFSGGVSVSSQLDYDVAIRGLNIASIQGTWQLPNNTVYNFLYDYRSTAMLSLGNVLFFQDPSLTTPARTVQQLLRSNSIQALRDQIKGVTGYQKQALLGVTTPLSTNWQIGGDVRLNNTEEVKPVAVILPNGLPCTGNVWSVGAQLIGTNLYSSRDTHVFSSTLLSSPNNRGVVLGYNNLSNLGNGWQLEPSIKFDRQTDDAGSRRTRWTPGMRVSYRLLDKVSLESELTYERSSGTANRNGTQQVESGSQVFYFLGIRYDL